MKVREPITILLGISLAIGSFLAIKNINEKEQCWIKVKMNGHEVSKHRPCTPEELKALGEEV